MLILGYIRISKDQRNLAIILLVLPCRDQAVNISFFKISLKYTFTWSKSMCWLSLVPSITNCKVFMADLNKMNGSNENNKQESINKQQSFLKLKKQKTKDLQTDK